MSDDRYLAALRASKDPRAKELLRLAEARIRRRSLEDYRAATLLLTEREATETGETDG